MQDYYCPHCGRFLLASDAPDGYKARLPRCQGCGDRPLLTFGRDAAARRPSPPSPPLAPSRLPVIP